MGGAIQYVYLNGQRLTAWMLYVITLLDGDLFQAFGVHAIVTSAIRTYAEQEAIFRERYVTAGNVNGRKVYDTRVWNGVRWYRISAAGTVAVPGTSNHEIQGDKAAVDIRDTGSDAGITVASSARGRWIRDWARRTGLLIASGDGFGEGWHFDVPGIFRTPPSGGGGSSSSDPVMKDDEMIRIQAPNRGIALIGPGYYRQLANDEEVNNSAPLISAHHSGNERQFDLWVSMAISGTIAGGVADIVRTEARPLKLYTNNGKLLAVGEGGSTWEVPSDAYRILLGAMGLAGPNVIRDIPDNELQFLQMVLGKTNPDPVTEVKVDAVLSIDEEDAERIASKIKVGSPTEIADAVREEFRADPLK